MKRLWDSLYSKVKSMVKGYIFGGGAAVALTEIFNAADVTSLSNIEQALWGVGTAAVLGVLSAYRKPETGPTPPPVQPLGPGEPEPSDLSDH